MNKPITQVAKAEAKAWTVHVEDKEGNVLLHENGLPSLIEAQQALRRFAMYEAKAEHATSVEVYVKNAG